MNEYKKYDGEELFTKFPIETGNFNDAQKNKKGGLPAWALSLIITVPICILTIAICFAMNLGSHVIGAKAKVQKTAGDVPKGSITLTPSAMDSDKAKNALLSVVSVKNAGEYGGFFGQSLSLGEGTGVIIREDGYILTSAAVVENVGNVTVELQDGNSYQAEVCNVDSVNNAAVLKIDAAGLTPAVIGDSSAVNIGDSVIAVGNEINENLSNPIVAGTVCGINNGVQLQNGQKINILQVDAATIAGSVGGLVFNKDGALIGIATAMISNPSSEIGIVTPIDDLKSLLSNFVSTDGGNYNNLSIGITGTDASYGVSIEKIAEGSPAEKAGLKTGDLIVKADGEAVASINDINNIKNRHKKGDTMTFSIYRDGEVTEINVVLE